MSTARPIRSPVPGPVTDTVREIGERFGIRNIRVFGSFARGEAGPESPVRC